MQIATQRVERGERHESDVPHNVCATTQRLTDSQRVTHLV